MAELVAAAGAAVAILGLLSAAYSTLRAAYAIYNDVDMRRSHIRILLDRCGELVATLAGLLEDDGDIASYLCEVVEDLEGWVLFSTHKRGGHDATFKGRARR